MTDSQGWDTFTKTGKIEDYLCYKHIDAARKHEAGGKGLESDHHSDGHDTFCGACRGV